MEKLKVFIIPSKFVCITVRSNEADKFVRELYLETGKNTVAKVKSK